MVSPILDHGRAIRISPRFEMLSIYLGHAVAELRAEGETLPDKGVWGATEQKTGLTASQIRTSFLSDNMLQKCRLPAAN
jgi:hypothetical protein